MSSLVYLPVSIPPANCEGEEEEGEEKGTTNVLDSCKAAYRVVGIEPESKVSQSREEFALYHPGGRTMKI